MLLAIALVIGLTLDQRRLPSAILGDPVPQFELTRVANADQTINPKALFQQPSILNVWASWCIACRAEHPLLMSLAEQNDVPIYGLNYKDQRQEALRWLAYFGNPYRLSAYDDLGKVGNDLGVYGLPETCVVDSHGIVQYKHIGPLSEEILTTEILPLIDRLRGKL